MDKPSQKTAAFRQLWEALLTTLKWLLVLAILGLVGLFAHRRLNPYVIADQKPSEVLKPIMSGNLPFLLSDLRTATAVPALDLKPIKKAIDLEKVKAGPLQTAWKLSGELCAEMDRIDTERKLAAQSFGEKERGKMTFPQLVFSKFESRDTTLRRLSYLKNPENEWREFTASRREIIRRQYLQILTAEKASSVVEPSRLVCPVCEGEGRITVRRPVNGTITDISSTCPLCIGTGMKKLKMPVKAKICPDCKGFGRRLIPESHSKFSRKSGAGDIDLIEENQATFGKAGVFQELPKVTSCTRCLAHGYILQPGL